MALIEEIGFTELLTPPLLCADYQPIIELASGRRVGVEALTRWGAQTSARTQSLPGPGPRDGWRSWIGPAGMPPCARRWPPAWAGRKPCSSTSSPRSRQGRAGWAGSDPHRSGPAVADRGRTDRTQAVGAAAELLRTVAAVRRRGWDIALDDVGAVPASLALLPFLAPDVIKLDMTLVHDWPSPDQAEVLVAVLSHAERTGAAVLAEGIETEEHLERALSLGATLGQGWYFGTSGPLTGAGPVGSPVRFLDAHPQHVATPF